MQFTHGNPELIVLLNLKFDLKNAKLATNIVPTN